LRRKKIPIFVKFGEPFNFEKGGDVEASEKALRETLIQLVHEIQSKYPDSHIGQRWAPARLGGTAPAPLN
jgi:hypothetical protein